MVSTGFPKQDDSSTQSKNFNAVKNVIVQILKLLINISNDNGEMCYKLPYLYISVSLIKLYWGCSLEYIYIYIYREYIELVTKQSSSGCLFL